MQQIIGLTGYAGVGKDEAAKALIELGWLRVSFADPIREQLYALNPYISVGYEWYRLQSLVNRIGWDEAKKNPEVRRLLQKQGTEAGRDILGPDIWVDLAEKKIDATNKDIIITDVRFPNEVAMVRKRKGRIVRILKQGVGPVNDHSSDNYEILHDICIPNDGTIKELHAYIAAITIKRTTLQELDR